MSNPVIQATFNGGEFSPFLYARVDLQKYRQGAALLENFFVDYRGGASTRQGTRYVLQAWKSDKPVRIIPFQPSFILGYILEFGDYYVRPFYNGAPILETAVAVTGATQTNPCVITVTNNWSVGDWIYISGVGGMTQLNKQYFRVNARTATTVTLGDLQGNPVDSTAFPAFSGAGTAARVYTITSPYAAADLALIKFAQNLNSLIICHPNYVPYELVFVSNTNWSFSPINFVASISAPTGVSVTTSLSSGSVNYAYIVTAVNSSGEESPPSIPGTLNSRQDLRSTSGTNTVTWNVVSGAVSYNVYKAIPTYGGVVASGVQYGYIGTVTGTTLQDSNITPDFSISYPVTRNPFSGSGVSSVTVTNPGAYNSPSTAPTVSFSAPPSGTTATGICAFTGIGLYNIVGGNGHFSAGQIITLSYGIRLRVDSVDSGGFITGISIVDGGYSLGTIPSNPFNIGNGAQISITWGVIAINIINPGSGYSSPPTVTFSSGTAAATATIGSSSLGNPSVPGFAQQRLWLANQQLAPQTFNASQPGNFYNFNISSPIQASDAIESTLSSGILNEIKAMVAQQAGMIILTNNSAWLITGGQPGSAITPISVIGNPQSWIGSNDVPPIVVNHDILFVQSKGSAVRNMSYNFYTNVYTGTDISVMSSHLFYGYQILEWALALEPFKLIWAVRDDGALLTLTFIKEQEFTAWSHHITQGLFKSIATIVESVGGVYNDVVYVVVQRTLNGSPVQYIERFVDRTFPSGRISAWSVDSGLQYNSTPTTTFSGAQHLAGMTVTGVADGEVIEPFVMPASGSFTLPTAASVVTIGLPFTAKLKTLAIDTGDPTIQGKLKKIPDVTVRCVDTLGIKIGSNFDRLVPMKDFQLGQVSGALSGQDSQVVTDLVTGDGITVLDPTYTLPGQYCIQQDKPYPATILGVIPNLVLGDTAR
jgi:hypothetical protein